MAEEEGKVYTEAEIWTLRAQFITAVEATFPEGFTHPEGVKPLQWEVLEKYWRAGWTIDKLVEKYHYSDQSGVSKNSKYVLGKVFGNPNTPMEIKTTYAVLRHESAGRRHTPGSKRTRR